MGEWLNIYEYLVKVLRKFQGSLDLLANWGAEFNTLYSRLVIQDHTIGLPFREALKQEIKKLGPKLDFYTAVSHARGSHPSA